jgi:uncharacterized protein
MMSQDLFEEYIQTGNKSGLSAMLIENPELALTKTSKMISPLMLSCYYKNPEISYLLMDYIPEINLFEAAAVGKFDMIAHLIYKAPEQINSFSEDGFTALGLASYFGHEEIIRYLILKGAEVNLPSQNGLNIYPIHSAVAANHDMIAKMLIEAGADVNVRQEKGITPLHSAAYNGNIELLIVLLEAGAEVNAETTEGKKPGDLAAQGGYTDIAKILVD